MNDIKIYEYESLEEFAKELPALAFNWTVIRICFELWRKDIIAVRKADLKLHKIVGVGENYINEMCAGRVVSTSKLFNAEKDMVLLPYLQGDRCIIDRSSLELKRYVALNIACNALSAEKKKITSAYKKKNIPSNEINWSKCKEVTLIDEWIQQQCKCNPAEKLKKLKNQIIEKIKFYGLSNSDDEGNQGLTIYGKLKRYLEGRNSEKVILSENQEKMALLFTAMYKLPYSTIETLDDESLKKLHVHVGRFFNKIEAEVRIREVKKEEQGFYEEIVQRYVKNKEKNN